MRHQFVFLFTIMGIVGTPGLPLRCEAQTQVLSTTPPVVEYQYQMYYPRYWGWGGYGFAWAGPGLSLGGSLPSTGREGISSFYGRPIPAPLGAGVYMNPFAYATQAPGAFAFGLASNTPNGPMTPQTPGQPSTQVAGSGTSPMTGPSSTATVPAASAGLPRPILQISSGAAQKRCQEMVLFGDDKLQTQQWLQAYINYQNAVIAAPDRAEAHERMGFASLAMARYPEAIREFKRALIIDPQTGKTGETLASIFGPETEAIRADILRDVAKWTRLDLKSQDRLFLLGFVLHYGQDARAREILEAAMKLPGPNDHLVSLLKPAVLQVPAIQPPPVHGNGDEVPAPVPEPPETRPQVPELHQQPLAFR